MNYLTLGTGHLLSILVPLVLLFNKLIDFQYTYFNRKYEYKIILFALPIAILGAFLFYINDFGKYFSSIWFAAFTFLLYSSIIFRNFSEKMLNPDKKDFSIYTLEPIDKFFDYFALVKGSVVLIIPFTGIHSWLAGDCLDYRVVIVSKIIFIVWGLEYFILNKTVILSF